MTPRIENEARISDLLGNDQAAAYLGRSGSWLNQLRASGGGPRYLKFGKGGKARVMYRKADLDAYLDSCVVDPAQRYAEDLADTRKKLGAISKEMLAQMQHADDLDAARYRWLRDYNSELVTLHGRALDEAVDKELDAFDQDFGHVLRAVLISDDEEIGDGP